MAGRSLGATRARTSDNERHDGDRGRRECSRIWLGGSRVAPSTTLNGYASHAYDDTDRAGSERAASNDGACNNFYRRFDDANREGDDLRVLATFAV